MTNFPTVKKVVSSLNCCFRFSIIVIEDMKFKCQYSHYLEFNLTSTFE